MVRHRADEVVQPTESSWFGFYKDGQSSEIETLQESELYKSVSFKFGVLLTRGALEG